MLAYVFRPKGSPSVLTIEEGFHGSAMDKAVESMARLLKSKGVMPMPVLMPIQMPLSMPVPMPLPIQMLLPLPMAVQICFPIYNR